MSEEKLNIKLPTDEKLIEWLRKIKEHCESLRFCDVCKFNLADKHSSQNCQFKRLMFYLWRDNPDNWDMEEIERIIKL